MRTRFITPLLPLVAAISLLAGCASTDENLQRATATEIGNTRTGDVTVSSVNRKATSVSWQAKAPTGCYECDADDNVRRVHCVKVECPK